MKCDDNLLRALLFDDHFESDHEQAKHIDHCRRCQTRLSELAADEDAWGAVAVALQEGDATSSVVIALDPEMPADMALQADRVSLDFLETPSHPEMLGRIGRYEVERLIGAGGMGIVLKAFDTELHRPVAVKVLAPHLAHSGAARQRFAREAKSAAAVVHENVVPIHNVEVDGKLPFLVMQYVAGESLQQRVDRLGPLSTDEVLRIGTQIASGLAAAHEQGLVHRDVKPGNVLLHESIDRVLISDFGLARAADDASVTRSGVIAGTPHYMSPEQARGESVDHRSDLFGLGSVLYFMCTGRPPFRADGAIGTLTRICQDKHRPVDEINHHVPAGLAKLIDCLLEKSAARRPANASEVANALTSQLHDTRRHYRYRSRDRKRKDLQRLGALASCVLLLVLLGWGLSQLVPPSTFGREGQQQQTPLSDDKSFSNATEPGATTDTTAPRHSTFTPEALFGVSADIPFSSTEEKFHELFDEAERSDLPQPDASSLAIDAELLEIEATVQKMESQLRVEDWPDFTVNQIQHNPDGSVDALVSHTFDRHELRQCEHVYTVEITETIRLDGKTTRQRRPEKRTRTVDRRFVVPTTVDRAITVPQDANIHHYLRQHLAELEVEELPGAQVLSVPEFVEGEFNSK